MRLFIAIDIPKEGQEILREAQSSIKSVRLTKSFHLTLKFVGDADAGKISLMLSNLKIKKFNISFSELGGFPRISYARIIYMSLDDTAELREFADKINLATKQILRDKRFSPHVTIACAKTPVKVEKMKVDYSFEVNEFILYNSKLTPDGPVYDVIRKFTL